MEKQTNEVQPAFIHTTIRASSTEMQLLKTTELIFEQDMALFNWIVDRFKVMGLGEFRHTIIETRIAIETNPIFPMREHEEKIIQMEREGSDEEWQPVWQVMAVTKDVMRHQVVQGNTNSRVGRDLESDFWIAQQKAMQNQERGSLHSEMDSWIARQSQG